MSVELGMNKQVVVSFSGGRTSAYLCCLIKKLHPDAVFVFMDTGAEHESTYEFIKQVNDYFDLNLICLRTVVSDKWKEGVSYRVIDIDEIGHDLQPWRDMSLKYGLPYHGGGVLHRQNENNTMQKILRRCLWCW